MTIYGCPFQLGCTGSVQQLGVSDGNIAMTPLETGELYKVKVVQLGSNKDTSPYFPCVLGDTQGLGTLPAIKIAYCLGITCCLLHTTG